jgi:hypothetical protein
MRVAAIPALPRRLANLSSQRRVSRGTRMLKVAVADMSEMYALCVLCQFICNRHSPPRKLATGSLFFRYLGASSGMVYLCHYLSFCDCSVQVFSRIHAVEQPAAGHSRRRQQERASQNTCPIDFLKTVDCQLNGLGRLFEIKAAGLQDNGRFSGTADPESRYVVAPAPVCLSMDSSK